MTKLTRRGFIKSASIGAGAMGILVTGADQLDAVHANGTGEQKTDAAEQPIAAHEPFMLVVSNPGSGQITVLHGEHERTISNPALVRKLLSM